MTAVASPQTRDEAAALQVPLLSKPFGLDELRRVASDAVRRRENQSQV